MRAHSAADTADGFASGGGSINIWDYTRVLVRHRWWMLGGFVVLATPVIAVTMMTTPIYLATSKLLLSEQQGPQVNIAGPAQPQTPTMDPRTQREVVRSRALARQVVADLKLWDTQEFGKFAQGTTDEEKANSLVDAFLGRLLVDASVETRLLTIGFESADPVLAAKAANTTAAKYIERDRESRLKSATDSTEWLTQRLTEQRLQVAKSEEALQRYREANDAHSLDGRQNIVVQKLGDINMAVTRAKTDRIAKETQFRQIEAIKDDPAALEAHPLVSASGFVQTLKGQLSELSRQEAQLGEKFGPKHPEMVQVRSAIESVRAKLDAEVARVVETARAEYEAAVSQENNLTQALNAQKSEASTLERKGVEYAALEREAVSSRQVFDALLQQTKEAALTSGVQRAGMRLVDEADPPGVPIRPRKNQAYAASLLLGLVGAVGVAFAREYLRTTVSSPADIEKVLGLPVLTLIPASPSGTIDTITDQAPIVTEAFRRLRTSVLLAGDASQPGNVLVVTSTAPQEGKTAISANLAVALAAADLRVVVIDADLRRARLHKVFDRERAPGLTDVLRGRRTTAEVLRPMGHPGPVLIPSGIYSAQASELLMQQRFRDFIDELRGDYDWIVIDSPPVMAVTDAGMLAHGATAVLFVTCADQTPLDTAQTAVNELHGVDAPIIGAVLNRAPVTREAYYYSRYYRPEYAAYLAPDRGTQAEADGAGDEGAEAPVKKPRPVAGTRPPAGTAGRADEPRAIAAR